MSYSSASAAALIFSSASTSPGECRLTWCTITCSTICWQKGATPCASPAARPLTSARTSGSKPPSRSVVPLCLGGWRDMAHRPLGERADGQAGVDPEVGGDHGAVADVQVPICEQAMARIDHAVDG